MDFIVPFDQIGVIPPGPWENAAPSSGVEGSIPNADFFPAVQNEILSVQDEAALARNAADFTQLLQAIRSGKLTAFVDTGSADALVVTPRTAYMALAFGMPIQVLKAGAANATTTPTLSVSGIVRQIVKEDGSALAPGDLPAGSLFSVISDGGRFRVVGLRKSDASTAVAANSAFITTLISNNYAKGSLISKRTWLHAGTYTYTPTAGTHSIIVRLRGAGGAGVGSGSPGAGYYEVGPGGGGGGVAESLITSGFSSVTMVVGGAAGGVQSSGAGATGGTSSFGSFLSATGGSGGTGDGPVANGTPATQSGGAGGVGYGGNLYNGTGQQGGTAIGTSSSNISSGYGGGCDGLFGPPGITGPGSGNNAVSPGCGGSGGAYANSGGNVYGGNGADGVIEIEEYA